ncbi:hypothetical protein FA10DRAFT_263046 [Acaromyces ingoldii]|uniref:Uncharacterized protein n=1 Tax=Acaromyces ingoldii TaxID=215250 RepID=A0A316YC05_9BASI|nr:hypothetical protein FA10DRAFT_263046 [Acaromyces ingoldii]PWN86779.1 hypothetical protein FA10DRAFT_263046 [Acaromyces ingoldii]
MAEQHDGTRVPSDNFRDPDRELATIDDGDTFSKSQDAESAIDKFLNAYRHPLDRELREQPKLTHPVVVPQRRPGHKERGFVKAYAPALQEHDISQEAFFDFIKLVNQAVQQNKWLVAIQLAAVGTSFVPSNIALGVSVAVQFIAGAIAEAEAKWRCVRAYLQIYESYCADSQHNPRTNSFLDRINREYFRPRGLYCLLMSYDPIAMEQKESVEEVDAISRSMLPESSSESRSKLMDRAKRNLRNPVAATTEGEGNLPSKAAALVYRDEQKSASPNGSDIKKVFRLNNYLDRRAQARYAKESKGDVLSNPHVRSFKNRYLDPNSSASNGGLLGFLSGGLLTPNIERSMQAIQTQYAIQEQAIQDQQRLMTDALQQQAHSMGLSVEQEQAFLRQYQDAYDSQLRQMQEQVKMLKNGQLQRRIVRNILYLMIVNMPSETEMAAARVQVNKKRPGPTDSFQFESLEV